MIHYGCIIRLFKPEVYLFLKQTLNKKNNALIQSKVNLYKKKRYEYRTLDHRAKEFKPHQ